MKFALFYPVAVAPATDLGTGLLGLDRGRYQTMLGELKEQAKCADESGWTSLTLAEHHFEVEGYQVTPNPLMLNVFLAQHTTRLRHGQMGLVLPNWNPLRLAEDIAMADHLTGGRLDIGLSRGYQTRAVGVLGQHFGVGIAGSERAEVEARNRRVFEEWFEVMRRSWTEDLWSHASDLIQVPPPGLAWPHPVSARLGAGVTNGEITQIATVPKPLQTPHPPMFTTLTQSPATLDWAARVGSSIVTIATDRDMLNGLFHGYVQAAVGYGRTFTPGEWRPDGGVAVCRLLAVARTHEQAMETARQSMTFAADWLRVRLLRGLAPARPGRPGSAHPGAGPGRGRAAGRHPRRGRRADHKAARRVRRAVHGVHACTVARRIPAGDHTILLGRVQHAEAWPARTPAVYLDRAHQRPGPAHADTGLWNEVVRPGARPR